MRPRAALVAALATLLAVAKPALADEEEPEPLVLHEHDGFQTTVERRASGGTEGARTLETWAGADLVLAGKAFDLAVGPGLVYHALALGHGAFDARTWGLGAHVELSVDLGTHFDLPLFLRLDAQTFTHEVLHGSAFRGGFALAATFL